MILQLPAETAVTTPVEAFTVATEVLLLLHAPLPPDKTTVFAEYVVVVPTQSGEVPVTDSILAFGVIETVTAVLLAEGHVVPLADHEMSTCPFPDWKPAVLVWPVPAL